MVAKVGEFPFNPDPGKGVLEKGANLGGEIAHRVDFRRGDSSHAGFLTHAPPFVKPFPPPETPLHRLSRVITGESNRDTACRVPTRRRARNAGVTVCNAFALASFVQPAM